MPEPLRAGRSPPHGRVGGVCGVIEPQLHWLRNQLPVVVQIDAEQSRRLPHDQCDSNNVPKPAAAPGAGRCVQRAACSLWTRRPFGMQPHRDARAPRFSISPDTARVDPIKLSIDSPSPGALLRHQVAPPS